MKLNCTCRLELQAVRLNRHAYVIVALILNFKSIIHVSEVEMRISTETGWLTDSNKIELDLSLLRFHFDDQVVYRLSEI